MCFRVAWQCYKRQNRCCRQLNAFSFSFVLLANTAPKALSVSTDQYFNRLDFAFISSMLYAVNGSKSKIKIEFLSRNKIQAYWCMYCVLVCALRRMNLIKDENERSIRVHCINKYSYDGSCVETRCCSIYCIPHEAAYSKKIMRALAFHL